MKNILLIEDEENLNRGISLKLKKEGYIHKQSLVERMRD